MNKEYEASESNALHPLLLVVVLLLSGDGDSQWLWFLLLNALHLVLH